MDAVGKILDCTNMKFTHGHLYVTAILWFRGHTELINCPGSKIPKPDESFSTVMSYSVLEHIEDLEPVLKEVHRLLKTNGKFYVTLPTNLFDRFSNVYQFLTVLGLKGLAESY